MPNNNPNSNYHRQCTACYQECSKRKLESLYDLAWHSEATEFAYELKFDDNDNWLNQERSEQALKRYKERQQ